MIMDRNEPKLERKYAEIAASPMAPPISSYNQAYVYGAEVGKTFDSFLVASYNFMRANDMKDPLNVKEFEMMYGVWKALALELKSREQMMQAQTDQMCELTADPRAASRWRSLQAAIVPPAPNASTPISKLHTEICGSKKHPMLPIFQAVRSNDDIPSFMMDFINAFSEERHPMAARMLYTNLHAMDKKFFHYSFAECKLCRRAMTEEDKATFATFCKECKCLVCFRCDCSKFHMSHQAEIWGSAVDAEEDKRSGDSKSGKKKKKTKRKSSSKNASKETRQEDRVGTTSNEEDDNVKTQSEIRDEKGIPSTVDAKPLLESKYAAIATTPMTKTLSSFEKWEYGPKEQAFVYGTEMAKTFDSFLVASYNFMQTHDMNDPLNVKEFGMMYSVWDALGTEMRHRAGLMRATKQCETYVPTKHNVLPPEPTTSRPIADLRTEISGTMKHPILPTFETINEDNIPSVLKGRLKDDSKGENRSAKVASLHAMDKRFFHELFVECKLCRRAMTKADKASCATFCKECNCLVCFRCDCSTFHMSHEAEIWGSAVNKGSDNSKSPKKKKKTKRKPISKDAFKETRQDDRVGTSNEDDDNAKTLAEIRDEKGVPSTVDLVNYLKETGSILELAALIESCESMGIDFDKGCLPCIDFPECPCNNSDE